MSQEGSGFQELRLKLVGSGGPNMGDRNEGLFTACPDSFPSSALLSGTDLLGGIWKSVGTANI